MSPTQIAIVSAGHVVAYDANTGTVLWTHEKFVEVMDGQNECPPQITDEECDQVKTEAAQVFRGQKVEAMIAPEEFAFSENLRISVDVDKKTLCEISEEPPSLADRFAEARN